MSPSRKRTPIHEAKRTALTHGKAGASLPSPGGRGSDVLLPSPTGRRAGDEGEQTIKSYPTPYAEANAAVEGLLDGVKAVLGKQMVGLYLYGSLAGGDFDPQTSDIDFLVVTREALGESQVAALEAMHTRLWAAGPKMTAKLEGKYLPLVDLPRFDAQAGPFPTVNEGEFFLAKQESDWIIQRWVLREQGVTVMGPPLAPLIEPVLPEMLRGAVLGYLREWWKPMLARPARLESSEYQAYAILSMCRALYTLRNGEIASKPVSAHWAQAEFGGWAGLIESALSWRQGGELGLAREAADWISFTLRQAGIGEENG
ncbi:MAG: DUF4111 domain-containing protein [Anaerolineaceae bacterium]|nr:DUF4111 domain-containing protein [Anaerolineaceae bacterium]